MLSSPAFSGPAENVAVLASAQAALGHEVSVAVDRKRAHPTSEEPAAPRLRALGLLDERGLELSTHSSPWGVARDLARLRRLDVEVIHAHFSHDHWLARLSRPSGAVLVRSVHAPRSLRRGLPFAHAYTIPPGQSLGRKRVLALPCAPDSSFAPPVDRASLRAGLGVEGAPLVGMLSTFQASRRHALGLEAFRALLDARPDARMVLVGDGILEPELRRKTEALGLKERVRFAGYQSGEAFVSWVQALDEVWILGLGNDWTGRTAAQARACGARVVAVDEGALGELADARVQRPEPAEVVRASLSGTRVERKLPTPRALAEAVLSLYGSAKGPR